MQQLLDLVQDILDNGRFKNDRTGVGCKSVFGRQLRFDLSKGFPIPTTKKTNLTNIARELLWFRDGKSNIHDPLMEGNPIWDAWAVKAENLVPRKYNIKELLEHYAKTEGCSLTHVDNLWRMDCAVASKDPANDTKEKIVQVARSRILGRINEQDIEEVRDSHMIGEIGPMYGTLMRNFDGVDQLRNAVELLRTNPNSRRNVVSLWNPRTVPDDSKSPEQNVLDGKGALACCHTLFQLFAEELTRSERLDWLEANTPALSNQIHSARNSEEALVDAGQQLLDTYNVPEYRVSLQMYQRSQHCAL